MKTFLALTHRRWQRGYVSVLVVLVLSMVVLTILIQSVRMSGTRALESQQYLDSVQALAIAEGGTEIALGKFLTAYNANSNFDTSCTNLTPTGPTTPLPLGNGSGYFSFTSAKVEDSNCKIRVKGNVGNANRTIETWVGLTNVVGTAGYGKTPQLNLPSTFGSSTLGVFTLAWRVKGSDYYDKSDPNFFQANVYCSTCGTNQLWYDELKGDPAIGGVGNSKASAQGPSYQQTLDQNRNYVMAGLVLGASSGAPSASPGFEFSSVSAGGTVSSLTQGTACDDKSNALVLGVSARGVGLLDNGVVDASAGFDNATLKNGTTVVIDQNAWSAPLVHYPNKVGSTPGSMGDVFVDIFYYFYKNPVLVSVDNSARNKCAKDKGKAPANCQGSDQIRVSSTTDLKLNTPFRTTTTGGYFSSTILATTGNNTVTIQDPLNNDLADTAQICQSGLCTLLPTKSNQLTLTLTGTNAPSNKGWVAGFACIANSNKDMVRVVQSSTLKVTKWSEVISK